MYPSDLLPGPVADVAALDPTDIGDAELCETLTSLARTRDLLEAAEARVLAELSARKFCDDHFGHRAEHWHAHETGAPRSASRRRLAFGRALLGQLSAVDSALSEGRISIEHARVLHRACNPRNAERFCALLDELIEMASTTVFEHWQRHVAAVASLLDEDGAHSPTEDLSRNKLHKNRTYDGGLDLRATLTGEHALIVEDAIDSEADVLFHQWKADNERCADIELPSRATLRALALTELCRKGRAAAGAGTLTANRPEVRLVANAEDPSATMTDEDGVPLADGTTRTLRCDALWTPIVVDNLGVPLDMGRTVRLATAAQRRAVAQRDGGCIFPGCVCGPGWCDVHHVIAWENGGATDVANLANLCRAHHGITHRDGWEMHATCDGWFWWRSPSGSVLHSQRHGRTR